MEQRVYRYSSDEVLSVIKVTYVQCTYIRYWCISIFYIAYVSISSTKKNSTSSVLSNFYPATSNIIVEPDEVLVEPGDGDLALLELWHTRLGVDGELDLVLLRQCV